MLVLSVILLQIAVLLLAIRMCLLSIRRGASGLEAQDLRTSRVSISRVHTESTVRSCTVKGG